ncbi:MAG TPA: hypothetical protein VGN88_13320, partial [Phycisphaerae bacterium]
MSSISPEKSGQICERRLLLVGIEPADVGEALVAQEGEGLAISKAETILEAVLTSGNNVPLILVGAGGEMEHLEAGIRSLRRVNPEAQIVLLCMPIDEVACRRATGWGANGYEILPLSVESVRHLMPLAEERRKCDISAEARAMRMEVLETPAASPALPAANRDAESLSDMPAIAMVVQTQLLEEIMEGTGARADFAGRALGVLKRQMGLKGNLKFVPAEELGAEGGQMPPRGETRELRRTVAFAGQVPFGVLVWQVEAGVIPAAHDAGILAQASNWLAAMLGLSQRYEQLRSLAITDDLSGAYNRRYFAKFMSGLLER